MRTLCGSVWMRSEVAYARLSLRATTRLNFEGTRSKKLKSMGGRGRMMRGRG